MIDEEDHSISTVNNREKNAPKSVLLFGGSIILGILMNKLLNNKSAHRLL